MLFHCTEKHRQTFLKEKKQKFFLIIIKRTIFVQVSRQDRSVLWKALFSTFFLLFSKNYFFEAKNLITRCSVQQNRSFANNWLFHKAQHKVSRTTFKKWILNYFTSPEKIPCSSEMAETRGDMMFLSIFLAQKLICNFFHHFSIFLFLFF